jgi:hypothetical protein
MRAKRPLVAVIVVVIILVATVAIYFVTQQKPYVQSSTLTSNITSTVTVTSTAGPMAVILTPVLSANTSLSIRLTPSPATHNSLVNVTLVLNARFYQMTGTVSMKIINVTTSWGASGYAGNVTASCVTDSKGGCRLTLPTPSTPGNYTITARFAGDALFKPTKLTTKVIVA